VEKVFENIKSGIKVANATRKLVLSDKQLLMYPVVSVIVGIIAAIIMVALGLVIFIFSGIQLMTTPAIVLFIVFILLTYFVLFFITTYFTVAMLLAFREFGKGKKISMGTALSGAGAYTTQILEWSIFYTIIATIIHVIEGAIRAAFSRYGFSGTIISGLITGGVNLALAAAVAFALPVIIDEKKGPIDTIKASTSFIMKNFGDTFGGLLYTSLVEIALILMGLGLIFIGITPYLFSFTIPGGATLLFAIAFIVIGFLVMVLGIILRYVLFNCFKLIVYDYKTRKTLPKGFDSKLIDSSIKRKKSQKPPFGVSPTGFGI
jgi:hypothetical protein